MVKFSKMLKMWLVKSYGYVILYQRGRSKRVENLNKYIEKKCVSSWSFTKNHKEMHGERNGTFYFQFRAVSHTQLQC